MKCPVCKRKLRWFEFDDNTLFSEIKLNTFIVAKCYTCNRMCPNCFENMNNKYFCKNCGYIISIGLLKAEIKRNCDFELRNETKNFRKREKKGKKKMNYILIHEIVKRKKQKPKYCEICNEYKKRLYLSSINHEYTTFSKDYMYLCSSCHSLYDNLKGLRIFSRNQKEYTWKMIYMLNFDIERYYKKTSYILEIPFLNFVDLIPTQIIESTISKRWYHYFKLNENKIMEYIKENE